MKDDIKISKGYRMKVSTHNLVKNLSELTGMDTDTIISQACLLLNKRIIEDREIKFNNNYRELEK